MTVTPAPYVQPGAGLGYFSSLLLYGNGTPQDKRAARIAALYFRLDSGDSPLYVKSSDASGSDAKTGWLPVLIAPSAGGFPTGVIPFGINGRLTYDPTKLFWDDTNNRLGVGNNAPTATLDVTGDGKFSGALAVTGALSLTTFTTAGPILFIGSTAGSIGQDASALFWDNVSNRLGLGTNAPTDTLHVAGGAVSQVRNEASVWLAENASGGEMDLAHNGYIGGSGWTYRLADEATRYLQINGLHAWYRAPTGSVGGAITWTQLMQLDSTGLGIGIAPSTKLHILGAEIRIADSVAFISFYNAAGSVRSGFLQIGTGGSLNLYNEIANGATIIHTTGASSYVALYANATEKVRISNTGLGINTAPGFPLHVEGNVANVLGYFRQSSSTGYGLAIRPGADTTYYALVIQNAAGSNVHGFYGNGQVGIATPNPGAGYELDVNGDLHYTTAAASSDKRFKKNIQPLKDVVAKMRQIRGVSFEWNAAINKARSGYKLGVLQYGVVAQEVAPVFPELVRESDVGGFEASLAVSYDRFAPLFIEAIKELDARLTGLEAKLGGNPDPDQTGREGASRRTAGRRATGQRAAARRG